MEYYERITELAEADLLYERDSGVYALHGTSIQAIRFLAEHGRMPVSGFVSFESSGHQRGEFYFVPSDSSAPTSPETIALRYAKMLSARSRLFSLFKPEDFSLSDEDIFNLMQIFTFHDPDQHLGAVDYEYEYPHLIPVLAQILKCQPSEILVHLSRFHMKKAGIIIALNSRIYDDYEVHAGDTDDDRYIVVPEGLPIDCIASIEPVGQEDYDALFKDGLADVEVTY